MTIPNWALRKANPEDRALTEQAHKNDTTRIEFKDRSGLKAWMKSKGWKISFAFLTSSFYKQLFASDENFRLALAEGVIEAWIPKASYTVPKSFIEKVDQLYEEESWNWAVEDLREIRRAIDAGVEVEIDGEKFTKAGDFYNWAHKRYHVLEEAADKWILDDR